MKLDLVKFKGEPVGVTLMAESDQEMILLWSLRGIPAKVSETFGMENPRRLQLCPNLPWRNVQDEEIER